MMSGGCQKSQEDNRLEICNSFKLFINSNFLISSKIFSWLILYSKGYNDVLSQVLKGAGNPVTLTVQYRYSSKPLFAIALLAFSNLPRPDEYNRYEAKLHELQQSLTGVYRCLWKLGKTTYSLIHELSRYFGSNQPQEDVVCESSFRLWPPQGAFHKRIHWWNWQSSI